MTTPPPPPFLVEFIPISNPTLEIGLNEFSPLDPALPLPELSVSKRQSVSYVGEQLRGILMIKSQLAEEASPVNVKIEYDSPHQLRNEMFRTQIDFKSKMYWHSDFIELDLTYPGMWTVVVSLTYETSIGVRTFRRVFNFQASVGVAIKYKISKLPSTNGGYVVETQVENNTNHTLCIHQCSLNAMNRWEVKHLQDVADKMSLVQLEPKDVYQYVFCLANGTASDAGSIHVEWSREPMGLRGSRSTGVIKI